MSVENALKLDDTPFKGRQLKVRSLRNKNELQIIYLNEILSFQ